MTYVMGIKKSWFQGKDPFSVKRGSFAISRPNLNDKDAAHILPAIGVYDEELGVPVTHHRLTFAIGFIDKETKQRFFFFRPYRKHQHTAFYLVDKFDLPYLPLEEAKRDYVSIQIQNSLVKGFGDLDPALSVENLRKALSINNNHVFVMHPSIPNELCLLSWLLVDRNYVFPEPGVIEEVKWVGIEEVQTWIAANPDISFHPYTVNHFCNNTNLL